MEIIAIIIVILAAAGYVAFSKVSSAVKRLEGCVSTLEFKQELLSTRAELLGAKVKEIDSFICGELATEYKTLIELLNKSQEAMEALKKELTGGKSSGLSGLSGLSSIPGVSGVKVSMSGSTEGMPNELKSFLEGLLGVQLGNNITIKEEDDSSMNASVEEQIDILTEAIEGLLGGMEKHRFTTVKEDLEKLTDRMQNWVYYWRKRESADTLRNDLEGPGKHYNDLIKHGRQLVEAEKLLDSEDETQRSEVYFMLDSIKKELSH